MGRQRAHSRVEGKDEAAEWSRAKSKNGLVFMWSYSKATWENSELTYLDRTGDGYLNIQWLASKSFQLLLPWCS